MFFNTDFHLTPIASLPSYDDLAYLKDKKKLLAIPGTLFQIFCLSNWLGLTIAAVLAQRTGMAIFLCLFVDWSSLDAAFERKAYSSDLCLQPNLDIF